MSTKMKTHSGAKKRFKRLKSGKVKRGQMHHKHLLIAKSHKQKRQSCKPAYVDPANMYQMDRLLAGH